VLLVAGPGVAAAQGEPPPAPPRWLVRLGGAAITANGTHDLQPAIEAAGGVLLAGRFGLLAEYIQHTAYRFPGQSNLNVFTRRFLLGALEWSPRPLDLEDLGDFNGSVRVGGGAVFRAALETGGALGVGRGARVALNRYLAAMLDVQGLVTLLPVDSTVRCPTDEYFFSCNPLASAGAMRSEAWVALLLEVRW
jgi:hypothetical protein